MRYIIIVGNPCDGFRFIGPFEGDSRLSSAGTAVEWAEREIGNTQGLQWHLGELESVEEATAES